ncbi:30S ribosomal protein S17 [candidate division WWE3 bacterium CG_4_9_14_3_um_filter_41_6]|uniref:30S ribosomal protein S17 n=1 Tax=candidate division WWE3 bacterium CG_4_10_14_0_2_um_filter_41_14 TaxID=1975072 RepID=A0A2M7TF50_UNCKA|nr:MAG: 30S ribosomal protein S17 [candidate division WWE3 bacterium CG_4_10_14_0_2_um_filter_41_14]PJA39229.1 MAG: 30S ribosomal protein S17 [candidate division WWE3 bacterium CG_4_9_14_3_um_filter_41_6]
MAKQIIGTVLRKSGEHTISVGVDVMKVHPRYRKRYTRTTVYQVHDPKDVATVGQQVTIVETRPISKTKRWIVVNTESEKS